jgi:hypothetical protein
MERMKRRDFLKTVGCGTAAALFSGCATDPKQSTRQAARKRLLEQLNRPNILWLISEDTSPDMACYGNPLVKTPNLDRLAREGALYTHAFVTGPVCSASRSAFMTGMYQTTIGAHHHRSHRNDGYVLRPPMMPITSGAPGTFGATAPASTTSCLAKPTGTSSRRPFRSMAPIGRSAGPGSRSSPRSISA